MLAKPSFHGVSHHSLPQLTHSNRYRLSLSPSLCPCHLHPQKTLLLPSSFSLFPSSKRPPRFRIRASVESQVSESTSNAAQYTQPYSVKIPFGDRHILVETGHMGRQASAAVTVTDGETIVYTSVCLADVPSEPSDFFPLSVHYQERFSAAGRTRLIDRPLRPTMLKGFYHETQVLSYDGLHPPDSLAVTAAGIAVALSEVPHSKTIAGVRVGLVNDKFIVNPTMKEMEDSELDLLLAGTDSAILMIEGYCNFLPEEKLLQAVEVGQVVYLRYFDKCVLGSSCSCIFFPSILSYFDPLFDFVPDAVRAICNEVDALVKSCGKPKMVDAIKLPPPELYRHVEEIAGDELVEVLQIKNKIPRRKALSSLEERVLTIFTEKGYVSKDEAFGAPETVPDLFEDDEEDEEVVVDGEVDEGDVHIKPVSRKSTPLLFSEVDVKLVFKEVTSKFLRKRIVEGGKRSDGRTPFDIRLINSQCGLLPRAHGSALFTRGETQYLFRASIGFFFYLGSQPYTSASLAVVTLGDKQMAQRIDNLEGADEFKRFYLQYTFPPSCVGEVGRMGAPSRREIGHGMLAERALEPIFPSEDDFPYTIRVESTITESNGSSSMASVCGACLALQDAGVPVKCSIAGIAMGLVLDTQEFGGDGTPLILSDITGSEDASGDMDFKVAGNEDGITAFQMDIKFTVLCFLATGLLFITSTMTFMVSLKAVYYVVFLGHQSDIQWVTTLNVTHSSMTGSRNYFANYEAGAPTSKRWPKAREMSNCSPAPSKSLSKYAPLIHVMKVKPEKINLIIGSGGKKVKSIIEETGVEAIDTQDDGIVKITARDLLSLEKSKSIISGLTMVPTVGDTYRNCEIKSLAPYGVFVEIAPGREGLCHISELSANWLEKTEDAFKIGDRVDVKLIEINEKGQLRLSRRALLPDAPEKPSLKHRTGDLTKENAASQKASDKGTPKKVVNMHKDGLIGGKTEQSADKSSTVKHTGSLRSHSQEDNLPKEKVVKRLDSSAKDGASTIKETPKRSSSKAIGSVSSENKSTLIDDPLHKKGAKDFCFLNCSFIGYFDSLKNF
ncbi:hypothetical protein HYC85_025489 [Camellia sinensis]|uniref:polyribonucleotide nucleotidyltransferase n=1 Tax=Camellia sinensis TaxID=4442 RepID=A0A7J7GB56_CAMSI|nr:hypothetical protein HYC85_025489 [Camellia sinensis]